QADGREIKIPIVCSAHSSEPRENVFLTLSYLWQHHLSDQEIDIPRPLFYSPDLRATFYRAILGDDLLHFIKNKDWAEIEDGIIKSAKLFARIHAIPLEGDYQFNSDNSRMATVIPGIELILTELAARFEGRYLSDIKKIYEIIIAQENLFLDNNSERWLVHGDAHPENVIKTYAGKIGIIDFTDFCRADFTRDLGAFSQQIEYKMETKVGDLNYARRMKDLFLSEYFEFANLKLTPAISTRIELYYNFAATRTAVYWLLKHDCDPKRADYLIGKVKADLKLK
ncbi:MAG: phosphotransferase, partial [Candidatus Falkowbacteria bacterium]|nr:phosphotransferase [Candidatus Falkowbacteria bacterium]